MPKIVDALDAAFYATFQNVEPCGKLVLLALGVSGSVAGSCLTLRETSAAMALVTAATEEEYHIMGFSNRFIPLNISPRMRLDDVVKRISKLPFEATDCALPMIWARESAESEKRDRTDESEIRESLQIQAALAEIGSQMRFQIRLPRADRARVLTKWKPDVGVRLDELPVGFDQATMKTIEQIDVLWLKRRSIVRAFEVEHTTSVYSGLLRIGWCDSSTGF